MFYKSKPNLLKRVYFPSIGVAIVLLIAAFEVYIYYSEEGYFVNLEEDLPLLEDDRTFLIPSSFSDKDLKLYLQRVSGSNSTYFKHNDTKALFKTFATTKDNDFHQHEFSLYNSVINIGGENSRCSELHYSTKGILVDKSKSLDVDLIEVMETFLKELPNNSYYQEIAPFFLERIQDLFDNNKKKDILTLWYQLAGSSVWLEDYGVHFMIRRLVYSPTGQRSGPIISLAYAQIFDANWNELRDTHLAIPGDSKVSEVESLKFPSFLKIPFYHDVQNQKMRYYGPEDPRITVFKNEFGRFEPLIIFNAFHKRFDPEGDGTDSNLAGAKFYRSMWISYPFQVQYGKYNTDGFWSQKYDSLQYTKSKELRINKLHRMGKQKNWTPFTGYVERITNHEDRFDRYIYFIYRWSHIEVLRCDVLSGNCEFDYKQNPALPLDEVVGELRGGTPLVSINELMVRLGIDVRSYIPNGREVWLGFARAHIDWCGCGPVMYRPNLVLVVKDSVITGEDQKHKEFVYKLSHVSSSISFDVDVVAWELENPTKLCWFNNILIPNGISQWVARRFSDNNIVDYMELTLSASDATVERVTLKNLLSELLTFLDIFITESSEPYMPTSAISKELNGYNDDNVKCAMLQSRDFCAQYGKDHPDPDAKS